MNEQVEASHRREVEIREKARRIAAIVDRLEKSGGGIWGAAKEIEDLQRRVMELESDMSEQSGNGK